MEIPKIARDALVILGLLWKRPRKQQNLNNHLLQLPVELILCIANFLNPSDLVLFSQTCYSLRAILQNTAKLSRTEYLSYLAGYARERGRG